MFHSSLITDSGPVVDLKQRGATSVLLVQFQSILSVCVSYVYVWMDMFFWTVSGTVTRGNKEGGFTLPLVREHRIRQYRKQGGGDGDKSGDDG